MTLWKYLTSTILFVGLAIGIYQTNAEDQHSSNFQNLDSAFGTASFSVGSSNYHIAGSVNSIVGNSGSSNFIIRHGEPLKQIVIVPPTPVVPPSDNGGGGGGDRYGGGSGGE